MTHELTLVARRGPTLDELRAALDEAAVSAGLGSYELVGEWLPGELPVAEVSAEVSAGELLLQVFKPSVSLTDAADPYTVRLGLAPPLDEDGHAWLTQMAMSGMASDEQVLAVLAVVRRLALTCDGFLVVNGEYVRLDGVPEPERLFIPAPPPKRAPLSRAFIHAFLDSGPVTGEPGWRWAMGLLRDVLSRHHDDPDLRPSYAQRDGEWRRFLPTDDALPDWWPDTQYLLTPEPYVKWELDPIFGPGDRLTELSAQGDLDPAVAQAFVPTLIDLARERQLTFGLVHAWHDDEPRHPPGLRYDDHNGRWMLLTNVDLVECLPELYWAQVFGPPWVELFGADVLASTPGYRVEEVAPGRWLVQLTEHLADVVDDHEAFMRARGAAKEHLGADAFHSAERGAYGTYRAAHIPTLAERGLVAYPDDA